MSTASGRRWTASLPRRRAAAASAALLAGLSACGGATPEASDAALLEATGLDFELYMANVEPVFTRLRGAFRADSPGGPSCVMCHTWQTNAPLKLEPLQEGPDGRTFWTEEQSRRNFLEVARLVTPGDPDNSRLLLAPLALRAGGQGDHTGGSFWASRDDPEWQALAEWVGAGDASTARAAQAEPSSVDFEFFQSCVQRIFVEPRPGDVPCTECHASGTAGFAGPIGEGRSFWDEEESRRNFEALSRLIEPGEPTRSRFLMHPLAFEGGGDYTHNGPRRWRSMDDPEWQTLARWVRGELAGPACPS